MEFWSPTPLSGIAMSNGVATSNGISVSNGARRQQLGLPGRGAEARGRCYGKHRGDCSNLCSSDDTWVALLAKSRNIHSAAGGGDGMKTEAGFKGLGE